MLSAQQMQELEMGKTSSCFLLILALSIVCSVLCKDVGGAPEIYQSDYEKARQKPSPPQPTGAFSPAGGAQAVYHTDYQGAVGHSPPHRPVPVSSPAGFKSKSFKNSRGR